MSELYFLDFHAAREQHRQRWVRALEEPCRVLDQDVDDTGFEVEFAEDNDTHDVVLYRADDTYLGRCDCDLMTRDPSSGPCVHLCRVRMLAIIDHVQIPEKPEPDRGGRRQEVAP